MGKKSRGTHDASRKSALAGGAFDTKQHRRFFYEELADFARRIGHTYAAVQEVPEWLIQYYISFRMSGGLKAGHAQNIISSLRVLKRMAGEEISETTSNKTLGLPRRDRSGKHRARTPAEFDDLVTLARNLDEGVMHIIKLMRWLGLRRREALMAGRSLEKWKYLILRGCHMLPVERGMKNKRPRLTQVLPGRVEETLAAIEAALEFCRHRDFEFISGCHRDLESAKSRLKSFFDRLPMRGELGSHSLRYTYAVDLALALLDAGVPPWKTLIVLSARLGHGPSRTQMILNVYCREIRDRFGEDIRYPKDFKPRKVSKKKQKKKSTSTSRTTMHKPESRIAFETRRPRRNRTVFAVRQHRTEKIPSRSLATEESGE